MPIDRDALRDELLEQVMKMVRDPDTKETARVSGMRLAADMLGVVAQRQRSVEFDADEEDEAPEGLDPVEDKSIDELKAQLQDLRSKLDDEQADSATKDAEAARGPIERKHREKLHTARKAANATIRKSAERAAKRQTRRSGR